MAEDDLNGDRTSEGIICEKALHIYVDLLKETPNMSSEGESGFTFKVSRGWFVKFKHRNGIHSGVSDVEAASSNKEVVFHKHTSFSNYIQLY